MSSTSLGSLFALFTAGCWAASALLFASAGRRAGAVPVAFVRILIAAVVLVVVLPAYLMARPGVGAPSVVAVGWLVVSALLGLAIGDLCTYESLVRLGPRRTTQLYPLGPVVAVGLGFLIGEHLSVTALVGVGVVLGSTLIALLARAGEARPSGPALNGGGRNVPGSYSTGEKDTPAAVRVEPGRVTGMALVYGVVGAAMTGVASITARQAFRADPGMDAFVATVVRVGSGAAMLWAVAAARGRVGATWGILRLPGVRVRLLAGTAVGPLLGMVSYVAALKLTPAGLVSTLVATSPLFVMPYVAWQYKARLGYVGPIATAVACGGVALIFWH